MEGTSYFGKIYRTSREHDTHRVDSQTMTVGSDSYSSCGLNYISGVLPFEASACRRVRTVSVVMSLVRTTSPLPRT